MYTEFYGLREKPFNTTPDPRFLYLTPGHREALAQLLYGVQERKGFVVLTGEVGTGKTTLLHALMQRLGAGVAVAFVVNSRLPFDEILEYALAEFGLKDAGTTRVQRLLALRAFLLSQHEAGRNTVLIVDEAQHLDPSTLEEVRLLSNCETPTARPLQIVLVGQPELHAKLLLPELRQFRQRVGLRCRIRPLLPGDTRNYIRTRLRVAGAPDPGLFSDRAIQRITRYAQGIPRLVNILCDQCLLSGFAEQRRRIDPSLVERAIEYLEEGARPPGIFTWTRRVGALGLTWPPRWGVAAVALVLWGAATWLIFRPDAVLAVPPVVSGYVGHLAQSARGLWTR